jgi:hypothetical protein
VPSLGEEDRRKARKTGETAWVGAGFGRRFTLAREGRSTVDFTLRLSSCRFDDASTGEISIRNPGSNKPTKTMCFQGVERLAKGIRFEPITFRI